MSHFTNAKSRLLRLALLVGSTLLTAQAQSTTSEPAPPPCLRVSRVEIQELLPEFEWLRQETGALLTACLDDAALTAALRRATNALAARGYVTTRLYVPEQDISGGTLKLRFVPGRVAAVRVTGAVMNAGNVLTLRAGDIVNTRAIDQATDQLRRLTSLDAKILIEPAEQPGQSNLVIALTPTGRALHGSLSVGEDDLDHNAVQITELSPRLQELADLPLQVTADLDNPLKRGDVLSVNVALSPSAVFQRAGSFSVGARESVPFGATLVGLGGGYTVSHTLQPGFESTLDYNGRSLNVNADISRVLTRDATTTLSAAQKFSSSLAWSYIDDVEIQIQRKNTYRSTTGLTYAVNTPATQFSVGVNNVLTYHHFVNSPETGGWSDALQPSVSLSTTRLAGKTPLRYTGTLTGQLLLAGEQYQLYTVDNSVVRGLPGTVSFSGPHAVALQNRVLLRGTPAYNPYFTIDGAWLSASGERPPRLVMASTLGVQGQVKTLNYDVRVGLPLTSLDNGHVTVGLQLSWSF